MKGTHIGMTRLLVQHLLHRSKGEMWRWEQTKGHSKRNKSMAENHTKSLVQNLPINLRKEDYWSICLNKSWGMKNPAIFSLRSPEPYQEQNMTKRRSCAREEDMGGRHERRHLLSVLMQLPHPNGFGDCSGSALQGSKVADWVYFARSYFRTPEKTKEIYKSTTNEARSSSGRLLTPSQLLCI